MVASEDRWDLGGHPHCTPTPGILLCVRFAQKEALQEAVTEEGRLSVGGLIRPPPVVAE